MRVYLYWCVRVCVCVCVHMRFAFLCRVCILCLCVSLMSVRRWYYSGFEVTQLCGGTTSGVGVPQVAQVYNKWCVKHIQWFECTTSCLGEHNQWCGCITSGMEVQQVMLGGTTKGMRV